MTPIYVYDTIQPATTLIPSYLGPLVELECNQAFFSKIADVSAIFGSGSTLAVAHNTNLAEFYLTSLSAYQTLTDNIVFKGFVVALFIYYCVMVFHFRDCIKTLFRLAKIRADGSLMLDDSTYIFTLFLRATTIFWFVASGVAIVKLTDIFASEQTLSIVPQLAVPLLIMPASILLLLIMLYKKIIMSLVAKVTSSESFTSLLSYIKTIYTAVAVMIIVPSILFLSTYAGDLQNLLMYIIAAEAIVVTCLWLYKTYMLFVEQNVSILHWFLYLCAVEIFPFTLLILISLRLT